MNATDAADATVHDYPGGSESLAPRLGMSAAVLRNKVNPNNDRNHLTLAEAGRLMMVTGDHRILQAMAAEHGYAMHKVDGAEPGESIMSNILSLGMREGEFAKTLRDALADQIISDREMKEITDAYFATQATQIALIHRLRAAKETSEQGRRVA